VRSIIIYKNIFKFFKWDKRKRAKISDSRIFSSRRGSS